MSLLSLPITISEFGKLHFYFFSHCISPFPILGQNIQQQSLKEDELNLVVSEGSIHGPAQLAPKQEHHGGRDWWNFRKKIS